jgi:predicted AlkP superfamily pyrophosphatase or phosphodiesterase
MGQGNLAILTWDPNGLRVCRFNQRIITLTVLLAAANVFAGGKASHVVVIVWDGMRPDFVSAENTPALWNLAKSGVTFRNHHAVYISTTEVNGTALATGMYPAESGIIGNKEFRPAIDNKKKIQTESVAAVRKGDSLTGNHYLGAATVAEQLHSHGLRTVIAGAKPVALLLDRAPRAEEALGINLFEGNVLPKEFSKRLRALGPFPEEALPKTKTDRWTTEALTGPLWEERVPAFSFLWLSEPDYSQHETGPGSPTALAGIRGSDLQLARVLATLEKKGLREVTDIIVISDHGFSTIAQNADVVAALNSNGFHAARRYSRAEPRDGEILVIGNGGSAFLYVSGHGQGLIQKVVHFLQTQPFCGVVFAREPVEGAFTLEQAKINSVTAPDIVISLHWERGRSTNGTPGLLCSDYGEYGPGQGMHGSLSPFDLHNLGVAAGPDFTRGLQDDLPTGNIDIAPTVLWLLGIEPARKLSGRVLHEALAASGQIVPAFEPHHLEATFRADRFEWRQYLNYSQVDGVVYFDEGNGERTIYRTAQMRLQER